MLEYMACKRAIVAPRRDSVQLVAENAREALLFEPRDTIDIARKVLRLLGEPILRDRLAAAAYERVRRDFTASAARRALRHAYTVIAERFGEQFSEDPEDESPKVEMLADDDFEATVFEEAPVVVPIDTALNQIEDEELDELNSGHTSSNSVVAPPPRADQTMERAPIAPPPLPGARAAGPRASTDAWTQSTLTAPASGHDDWVVTNVAQAVREIGDESGETGAVPEDGDGTPVEGVAPAPAALSAENTFVAGEIDVPTPPPEEVQDGKTPQVEFTAASSLLGNAEPSDPDTGSRTPPLQRRSGS
jgi:hypothetical protein